MPPSALLPRSANDVKIKMAQAEPYSKGLAGVDLATDRKSSTALYGSLAFILLLVFVVRLVRESKAYFRRIVNLESSPRAQVYWGNESGILPAWIKRHILYAPLKNKRHNREIQLSNAVNVGTIPSRLHTILLAFYLLSNAGYCLLLDYSNPDYPALIAQIRGRTGHLAVVNMVPLFLLAGRNNPLIPLLRISFDTFNLFHRWIGRIVVLESVAHIAAWMVNALTAKASPKGVMDEVAHSPFLQFGAVGAVAMLLILIQSPSAIRHAFYETFLHIHQLLALVALIGVFVHVKLDKLPQMSFLIVIVTLWTYDRLARWFRVIYRNFSFTRGATRVTVEALQAEACRVTFDLPRPWTYRPGCHVYVYLPSVSFWMSHPFSVAWYESRQAPYHSLETRHDAEKLPSSSASSLELPCPGRNSTSVSLVIAARTGMTRSLYNRAVSAPSRVLRTYGAIEGPYAGHDTLTSYGTVILFAGGVGITHQIGHVKHLLELRAQSSCATRKIVLIWCVRSFEQLEWVKPWMDEILGMPGRRDMLRIQLFISQPKSNRETVPVSERVLIFPGRAKPRIVLEKECRERVGAMCVGVCGPGALADEVRAAVRGCLAEEGESAVIDFWEEAFTW